MGNQTDPRSVKAFVNDGRSRYYGIESLVRFVVSSRWSLEGNYTFLVGRELDPNRAATRLPPQFAYIGARHSASGRRPWLAVGVRIAGVQSRLSGADISDLRIGAARSRRDIADFFNGSRVRAYLDPQRGIFLPTGETLRQIQDRVLPLGETINGVTVDSDRIPVPLRLQTDGWFAVDAHGGFPLTERISLAFSVVNVFDANYRVHGSGVDGVGLNVYTCLRYVF